MTSKEALTNIKNLFIGSPINPTEQFEIIEKDLEVLEILKNYSYSPDNLTLFIAIESMNFDELVKVKEWLENEIH